jgi:hypothetical protein
MPQVAKVNKVKVARPDERIRREMKEVDNEFQKLKTDYRPPQMARPDPGEDGLGHRFPAKLVAVDPDDERLEMKLQAPNELGVKFLEKDDLNNLKRKKQNLQWAEFEVSHIFTNLSHTCEHARTNSSRDNTPFI